MPVIPDIKQADGRWTPAAPDIRAAMAPGMAIAHLGQSITHASQDVGQIVGRMQQIRNEDAIVQARTDVMTAQTEHAAFRAKNPDPTTWEPDIQKRYHTIREKYQSQKLNEEGRHQLDNSFTTWTADAINSTRVDALQYEATRARQNIANLDLEYRKQGKYAEARQLQDKAVEVGVYTPVEGHVNHEDINREEIESKKKSSYLGLSSEITIDPIGTIQKLSEKNPDGSWKNSLELEPGTRTQLINQAEIQKGKETLSELQLFTHSLNDYSATEAELQTMPNFLGPAQKDAILSNYRRATPPTADELKVAWDTVDSLRKLKDDPTVPEKQYLSAFIDAKTTILPLASHTFRWDVSREMDALNPQARLDQAAASSREYSQEDKESEGRAIITQARNDGSYGDIHHSDRKIRAKAILAAEQDRLTLNRWITSEKAPSPASIQAFARDLVNGRHLGNTTEKHSTMLPGLGAGLRKNYPSTPAEPTSTHLPAYPQEKESTSSLMENRPLLSRENIEKLSPGSSTGSPSINLLPLQ